MQQVLTFIGLLCAVCLSVEWAGSIQFIKEQLNIAQESNPKNLALKVIRELVNCCLCSGFWFGVVFYYFQPNKIPLILMGCLTSVGSETFYRLQAFIYYKLSGGK
jgi:hypothetical protein